MTTFVDEELQREPEEVIVVAGLVFTAALVAPVLLPPPIVRKLDVVSPPILWPCDVPSPEAFCFDPGGNVVHRP